MLLVNIKGMEFSINGRWLRMMTLRDDLIDDIEDPETVIDICRRERIPADVFVFSNAFHGVKPIRKHSMEWDNIAAVPITTYEHWLTRQIHRNTRNKINKAKRSGVVVKTETLSRKLAEGMVAIFNETPVRRGRPYSYYGRDAETVEKEWARDLKRCDFLVAYYQGEIIGFIQLVYGRHFARTSGTVAKIAYRNKSPMNALVARAIEVCAEKGVPYLVYGKYTYGNRGEDSLSVFKKNNGFQKIDIPRYFVPLSPRGRVAVRFGLHRGLSSLVPRKILALLLQLRSKWYGRK
jgi:hypothetical protein